MKIHKDFFKLLGDVFWPKDAEIIEADELQQIRPMYKYHGSRTYYTGIFFSRKMNREVFYNSLENLHFLLCLENYDAICCYYEFPFQVEFEYEGSNTCCYPHVFAVYNDGRGFVTEIVKKSEMAHHKNITRFSAIKHFCAVHGYGMLVTDGRKSIRDVMQKKVDTGFERAFMEEISKTGSINYER